MSEPPEANSPIATGDVAVKDIGSVVDFILRRRNISRLNLLGWSWGTTLMATYTTQNPGKVEKLILYAPVWIRQTASLVQSGPGKLGAYRTVTREQAKERWYTGVPEEKKGSLIPPGWFDAWADATFATDPVGAQMNPPVLRAPNGVIQDGKDFFGAGKPYYDPSKITVPTLLIDAEWDRDGPPYMAHTLFPLLVNSPGKRYVELAEGTHTIIMEKKPLAIVRGRAGLSGGGQPLLLHMPILARETRWRATGEAHRLALRQCALERGWNVRSNLSSLRNAIRASEHGTSEGDAAIDRNRDPDSIIAGAGSKENCDALHVFVGANPASGNSLRHLLRLVASSSIHFRRKRARSYRVDTDVRLDQASRHSPCEMDQPGFACLI
jgi:pimeloyl-ACP methyl ester carboxylesterase